ncbi:carbohydrate kinase family protein [Thermodesulfobacteriota bacterium]
MDNTLDKIQVIGLGQACLDCLGEIPFYPQEDGKVELREMHIQCGGPASTALVTLSRLGITTSFIGSISDDYPGREILRGLQEDMVDTTFLKITPGYTSQFAFIAVTESTGNRNVFWHRGSAPFLEPFDVDLSRFQNARILHLDGLMIGASIEAAEQAREMGLKIVCDAGTMREGFLELISIVDVLIASEGFAKPLVNSADTSPERALDELSRICSGDVVITLGSRGSIGYFKQNVIFQEAFPVMAVDTTGAGDVYHGAYIYGLLQGWSMPECMRFASATSAIKCKEMGARKGIPGLDEIIKFMDNPDII